MVLPSSGCEKSQHYLKLHSAAELPASPLALFSPRHLSLTNILFTPYLLPPALEGKLHESGDVHCCISSGESRAWSTHSPPPWPDSGAAYPPVRQAPKYQSISGPQPSPSSHSTCPSKCMSPPRPASVPSASSPFITKYPLDGSSRT